MYLYLIDKIGRLIPRQFISHRTTSGACRIMQWQYLDRKCWSSSLYAQTIQAMKEKNSDYSIKFCYAFIVQKKK